jgi:hypothetical protein
MGYSLVCSECRGRTPFNGTYPRFCSHCGADTRPPVDDGVIAMPAFLSAKTKATDKVYRDTERGSEIRAHAAAELAGVHVSEMADLKITNMNDRRDAEIAAMPVVNDVTRMMDAAPKGSPFGFAGGGMGGGGAELSPDVQAGPYPNAGARMRTALHDYHSQLTHGVASSDNPAKETLQPGYRRRG